MSIERALTAIEAIAAALTTIAAAHAPAISNGAAMDKILDAAKPVATTEDKPVATEKPKRSRPEIAKATGIKVEDQDAALIVAKALVGDQKGAPEANIPEPMDYEILKRAVIEVGSYNETGRQAVIKMLGDHGVKNAKDIDPAKRETFHKKLLDVLTDLQNAENVDDGDDNSEFA